MSGPNRKAPWVFAGVALSASIVLTSCTSDDAAEDDPAAADENPPTESAPPDATLRYVNGAVSFGYSNGRWATAACSEGNSGSTRPSSSWPWPNRAGNGCAVRVWLYEYADYTGATLCLNPRTDTGILHQTWRRFRVTSNTSRCP
jgi:hypothetical protein